MDDDDFSRALERIVGDTMREQIAEERPELEDVIAVIRTTFGQMDGGETYDEIASGPECWIWTCRQFSDIGFQKVIVLTRSMLAGAEGHPLVTVRQAVSPKMDSHLTQSSLVIGRDPDRIARSIGILIMNHNAAFQGIRDSIVTTAHLGPDAGLERLDEQTAEVTERHRRLSAGRDTNATTKDSKELN